MGVSRWNLLSSVLETEWKVCSSGSPEMYRREGAKKHWKYTATAISGRFFYELFSWYRQGGVHFAPLAPSPPRISELLGMNAPWQGLIPFQVAVTQDQHRPGQHQRDVAQVSGRWGGRGGRERGRGRRRVRLPQRAQEADRGRPPSILRLPGW